MRVTIGRRALWLGVLYLCILLALGWRLYTVQVVKGELYARAAHRQRTLSLPVASRRGEILDRSGHPLSDPQPGWGVAAFPPLVADREGETRAVAALLRMSEAEVAARLRAGLAPSWIATEVGGALAERIRQAGLPGIVTGPLQTRYGPGSLAHHLVGYINGQGGQLGLERAFERELTGDAVPSLVAYLDGHGAPLAGLGVRVAVPAVGKQPYSVFTTVDGRVQRAVERVLDAHRMADGSPLRAAVVVMDPYAGDILALASRPDFDQMRDPGERADRGDAFLLNRAVAAFEPGSVFKAVIAAAALEGGYVQLDNKFYCDGYYRVGGQEFKDAGGVSHGWLTFREAIAKSCNVTFARVGYEKLGAQRIEEAARRFGFGGSTGAGLPEEQAGLIPQLEYGGQVAQAAFGQGIMVTPLQIARAYAAVANGGVLPPVRLVTAIKNPAGKVMARPPAGESVRVISAETAGALQQALVAVTDPRGSGTGKQAWVDAVGSAGKTGSAEGTENGHATVHAWFAGYLPASAPRYVIAVLVQGGGYGGEVAAPIFREVGEALTTGGY